MHRAVADVPGLVSAVTALVAVIVGPIVAYRIATRQITSTVVSASRQAWINQLRDSLAEFHSLLLRLIAAHRPPVLQFSISGSTAESLEDRIRRIEAIRERASYFRERIVLMLNPTEAPHEELQTRLDAALALANEKPDDSAGLAKSREELTALSRRILKAEWERVKQGT
jgi:hypothetical protein